MQPAGFKAEINLRTLIVIVAVLAYIAITAFWLAVSTEIDHDEHQFMASAYMVAEHNLHPYRDFSYFHMPNLVYVYAIFFLLTDYPFLWARLFSALCGMGIAAMTLFVSRSLWSEDNKRAGLIIAASTALLFTDSQLFASAASHVWNHTPPTLCALLAFVFHCRAIRRSLSWKYFLLSGFCLGFALGIRLTFAPLIIPFVAATFLTPARDWRRLGFGVVAFGIGGLAANLPALYFLATSTEQFLFGNLRYPRLNTLFRQQMDYDRAMTLGGKASYLFQDIFSEPGNLLIAVAVVYSFHQAKLKQMQRAIVSRLEFTFLLLLLPFLYLGSFTPTPSQYQYFFAPLPFLTLVVPYALSCFWESDGRRLGIRLLLLVTIFSFPFSAFPKTPSAVLSLFRPDSWFPVSVHRVATEIAGHAVASRQGTKILTLSPLYAVEAKLPIYPQLVTGHFAWRISHLLSPADRRLQSVIGPAEVESFIEQEPPIAILTTTEAESLKEPLVQAARKLGYRPRTLYDGSTIWIASR